MSECRDWLSTLWPASFRGFPFYFESDGEEGGRGLVIHEFPNRDDPFVEDLGEAPRYFEGSAYVHGDDADRLAAQFTAALSTRGPATLVTPIGGPVIVHCQTFKRQHSRDRLGYVAFEVRFVRDGAASAIISIPLLAHAAYAAAQGAAVAIAVNFARNLVRGDVAEHILDVAVDGVAMATVALDAARESYPVDPRESSRLRDLASAIIAGALPIIAGDSDAPARAADIAALAAIEADADPAATLAAGLVAQARSLGDAMPAESALRALGEVRDAFPAGLDTRSDLAPSLLVAARNERAAARLARLAAMVAYTEALMRKSYGDRSAGVTARADVGARFEQELLETTGADHADLYRALVELQGRAVDYLSRVINDLAPVIDIEAARQMPSLYWSYRLYGVADRGGEIVSRNNVRHPSFIPQRIAALAR